MADKPPPAKRVKFNYKETFEVLTGEKPNQERFTVHRQPFIERSKFLEAAISFRWTLGTNKPVDLTEHQPEVFASYMQCVYHGSVPATELSELDEEEGPLGDLITLYLLADKLKDIITANLVISEIMRVSEEWRRVPNDDEVTLAYKSTTTGNPLRRMFRDYYIHEAWDILLEELEDGELPFQFVKDVLLEYKRLAKSQTPHDEQNKVKCVDREKCYYHQHDGEHPRCS